MGVYFGDLYHRALSGSQYSLTPSVELMVIRHQTRNPLLYNIKLVDLPLKNVFVQVCCTLPGPLLGIISPCLKEFQENNCSNGIFHFFFTAFMCRMELVKHSGGCHCGAVRFEVWSSPDLHVFHCNCSICTKKQNHHFIVPKNHFTLLQGLENLTTYTFNTHVAKHTFCRTCGVQSFYTPRSNPDGYGENGPRTIIIEDPCFKG
uniref:Centromere protein V n=1 Tax=Nothobranchius furzeri TaxID=105023 RepID=A0A8C6KYY3_NOTFU